MDTTTEESHSWLGRLPRRRPVAEPVGEDRVAGALARDELVLEYQPQVDLMTGRVVAAEALLRWPVGRCADLGTADLLAVAERSGLIRPLTRFVLGTAVRHCAAWVRDGLDLRVSVNLSPLNLAEPDLADDVLHDLDLWGLPPERLRLEVTETLLMADLERAGRTLSRLRACGVGVAIDDFGSGFSSLGLLARLPVDELKLDRMFLDGLGIDRAADTVVRSVVALGRDLGLDVVAEGVEHLDQRDALADMGCPSAQGFLFSPALPPASLESWVRATERTGRHPALV
jgi:EAL domain-containing protein (putative c-di-GMP-specific phosphodiesterase class I)